MIVNNKLMFFNEFHELTTGMTVEQQSSLWNRYFWKLPKEMKLTKYKK